MKKLIPTMLLITNLLFPLNYQYNGQKLNIDDKKIEKAFNLGIANFTEEYGDSFNEEELKIIILNNILGQEVLLNSTYGNKVTVSGKEVEEQFAEIERQFPDEDSFEVAIKAQGFTRESLKAELKEKIKLEKAKSLIESQAKVSEEEIKSYYEKNKFNDYFIGKSYENVKEVIKEALLDNKQGEFVRYFVEAEKEKAILPKTSNYSKFYSKVVYEKDGFKFTNVDFGNRKIMMRIQGLSDEKELDKMVKEAINKELKIVNEAKKLKLTVSDKLSKDDKLAKYREEYQYKLLETTKVTKEEIEKYFDENRDKYLVPETYDADIIELPINVSDEDKLVAKTKAQEILDLALQGEDFLELAMKYSEDGSAENGGNLGWFSKGQMVESFEDEVFAGEIGKVIPHLVETEFGYHIVKVEDKNTTEANASHILIQTKPLKNSFIMAEKITKAIVEQINSNQITFEEAAMGYSMLSDTYEFNGIIKDQEIQGIGLDDFLNRGLHFAKLNEVNYVVKDRAFIFMKTKHTDAIEPTLENSYDKVKYDLMKIKVNEQMKKLLD